MDEVYRLERLPPSMSAEVDPDSPGARPRRNPRAHRYSASERIAGLRKAQAARGVGKLLEKA